MKLACRHIARVTNDPTKGGPYYGQFSTDISVVTFSTVGCRAN
jgi:hypothetical protein